MARILQCQFEGREGAEEGDSMAAIEMEKVVRALPGLLAISRRVWIDYDEGADVL